MKGLKRLEYNSNQRARYRNRKFLIASYRSYDKYYIPQPVPAEFERREMCANLNDAIGQLLPEQQNLIWQRFILEIPATEIARREDVHVSAISHRMERIYKRLKKILAA
ncbi:MAG: hypothetical protein ACOYJB_08115 [Christensenellaceae bacterium]